MSQQIVSVVFVIVVLMGPTIAISFAMTAQSARRKAAGYYGLSIWLFLAALGCFSMAATGENRAGFIWMTGAVYGSYWAWMKARRAQHP